MCRITDQVEALHATGVSVLAAVQRVVKRNPNVKIKIVEGGFYDVGIQVGNRTTYSPQLQPTEAGQS